MYGQLRGELGIAVGVILCAHVDAVADVVTKHTGNRLRINRFRPLTNTNTASTSASTMLMFDSHWIPRAIPETADNMKARVNTAMIITSTGVATAQTHPLKSISVTDLQGAQPQRRGQPEQGGERRG